METLSEQTPGQDWEKAPPVDESVLGDYRVELPVFEGPLDLLLHLIRKHEIDIFDIPIALITDKYLAYLEWMRVLDIDIASEFLVMAATLTHIKSRLLLPPDEAVGEDEEPEEDPREELVRRLLEYQRYKEAADDLRDRPILNRDVFVRGVSTPAEESDSPFNQVSVYRLIEALDRVLKKVDSKVSHKVFIERVSIADRIHELSQMLAGNREMTFEELFEGVRTRSMVVATFLAILEMARLHMIRLHQADDSEVIHIRGVLDTGQVELVLSNVNFDE